MVINLIEIYLLDHIHNCWHTFYKEVPCCAWVICWNMPASIVIMIWCDWVLAYFQWHENKPFAEIWDSISIRMLQKMYPTLHEADISKTVDTMTGVVSFK